MAITAKPVWFEKTALDAIGGRQINRNRADMELLVGGKLRNLTLLVSAAPFDHEGERLAVVVMEDITELSPPFVRV